MKYEIPENQLYKGDVDKFFSPNVEAWQPYLGARPQAEDKKSDQESQPTAYVVGVAIAAVLVARLRVGCVCGVIDFDEFVHPVHDCLSENQ